LASGRASLRTPRCAAASTRTRPNFPWQPPVRCLRCAGGASKRLPDSHRHRRQPLRSSSSVRLRCLCPQPPKIRSWQSDRPVLKFLEDGLVACKSTYWMRRLAYCSPDLVAIRDTLAWKRGWSISSTAAIVDTEQHFIAPAARPKALLREAGERSSKGSGTASPICSKPSHHRNAPTTGNLGPRRVR
jgi:hypothetical protein